MYVAMNRFSVRAGAEAEFEALWAGRETRLPGVAGFRAFRLLRGPATAEGVLYISLSEWEDEASFRGWMRSEAFRTAHGNLGAARDLYRGAPHFEGFAVVLDEDGGAT